MFVQRHNARMNKEYTGCSVKKTVDAFVGFFLFFSSFRVCVLFIHNLFMQVKQKFVLEIESNAFNIPLKIVSWCEL